METHELAAIAKVLLAEGRGILAMDESLPTCNRRFGALGIAQTPEKRRDYRELLLSSPGLERYISGIIFFDETFRQARADGGSMLELATRVGMIRRVVCASPAYLAQHGQPQAPAELGRHKPKFPISPKVWGSNLREAGLAHRRFWPGPRCLAATRAFAVRWPG